jgi:hypothetical protein
MLIQAGGMSRSLPAVWRTLCCDCVQGEAGFAKYCTGLLTVATDYAGGLPSSKCYIVGPNFLEEAHVSNLVVFIGMGAMEPCHIV